MALTRMSITIDGNVFVTEGDFSYDDVSEAVRVWIAAQSGDEAHDLIQQLTHNIEQQTEQLAAAVAANTPAAQP